VTFPGQPDDQLRAVHDGEIAVVHCAEAFLFEPGNRLRAARCLMCGERIGGYPAAIIGVAALAGEACRCGGIVSDVFLIHAAHLPTDPDTLQGAIHRALHCACHD